MKAVQRSDAPGTGLLEKGDRDPLILPRQCALIGHRPRRLASWQVDTAMRLLRSGLGRPVSIAEIARACGLSPCYFIKAFTGTVGTSPYTWLIDRRVEMACVLIGASSRPLAQIALECGFCDQSHLTRTFAKRLGTTPARWRQSQIRDGAAEAGRGE
ncbi:helix-turn-helix domain-containing protein [Novosphingobium sp.]|uniref:helix-turn-helix domain-containing protein n=1 Tax=Novosphingobium sp. TaxID=1874826 RepID=UPI002FE3826F